jgi:hypothetical protein
MGFTGATPPNPPNYTKLTYADWLDNTKFDTSPPPYYDDGAAGSVYTFATNIAALASGTGATSGGTENTYPGASAGAVPASTSVAHEGAGTETSSTATGNVTYSYPGGGTLDTGKAVGCGPVQTAATILAGPNANHASTLSPAAAPTLTSASGASNVSGVGTTTLTATGTGFNRQSVIWSNGIAYPTTFVSATSLTCTAPKKATAGTLPVKVVTGGAIETATVNWTFT